MAHRLANHVRFYLFSYALIPILRLPDLTYIKLKVPRKMLWSCIGENLQHELLGFAAMRNLEIQQETSLTQQVLSFCREFFQTLQENVVKSLCVHLDYLLPNAPDNLHLRAADPTGFLT